MISLWIEHTYSNKGTYTFAVWAFFNEGQTDYSFESTEIEITNATGETNNGGLLDLSEAVTEYPGYELVWNDEFNYEGAPLDFRWHLQYKPILGWGWANDEKQHYTTRRDNSYVSDGTLKIVAKRESYSYNGTNKQFTSARLNSKFDMKYGRIDVRAKLPSKGGTWPAIWTLGTNINELGNYHGSTDGNVGWPRCGEIDIMEQRGYNKHEILGTFHWGETQSPYNYGSYGETRSTSQLGISNVTTNFHLYSLVWSATELKIYVDNKFLVSLSNSATIPFDNPHYLLLNVAMGGTLGAIYQVHLMRMLWKSITFDFTNDNPTNQKQINNSNDKKDSLYCICCILGGFYLALMQELSRCDVLCWPAV